LQEKLTYLDGDNDALPSDFDIMDGFFDEYNNSSIELTPEHFYDQQPSLFDEYSYLLEYLFSNMSDDANLVGSEYVSDDDATLLPPNEDCSHPTHLLTTF